MSLLSTAELADLVGMPVTTLKTWVAEGRVTPTVRGGPGVSHLWGSESVGVLRGLRRSPLPDRIRDLLETLDVWVSAEELVADYEARWGPVDGGSLHRALWRLCGAGAVEVRRSRAESVLGDGRVGRVSEFRRGRP